MCTMRPITECKKPFSQLASEAGIPARQKRSRTEKLRITFHLSWCFSTSFLHHNDWLFCPPYCRMTRTIRPNHGHMSDFLCDPVVLVSYTARVPAEPKSVRQSGNPSIYVGMRAVYMVAAQLRSYATTSFTSFAGCSCASLRPSAGSGTANWLASRDQRPRKPLFTDFQVVLMHQALIRSYAQIWLTMEYRSQYIGSWHQVLNHPSNHLKLINGMQVCFQQNFSI